MIDFKKNRGKLIAFGAAGVLCLVLFIVSLLPEGDPPPDIPSVPTGQKQMLETISRTVFEEDWAAMDKASSPLESSGYRKPGKRDTAQAPARKPERELSIYPAPSYVSEYADTLIYRDRIYIRLETEDADTTGSVQQD